MQDWYQMVLETGIQQDLIFEGSDLDEYEILMTPFVPHLSAGYLEKARKFVEKGGIWIVGPLTGGRTCEHTVHTDRALGKLEVMAGVETVYTYPMSDTDSYGKALGMTAPLGLWSSVFKSKGSNGARPVDTIEKGLTPDLAFITEHNVGEGKIVMLGSIPQGDEGKRMLQKLVEHYADQAEICQPFKTDVTTGTIVIPRQKENS